MSATRISTAQLFEQGLATLQAQYARFARTQRQLATGQRIATPSEDPAGMVAVLDAKEVIERTAQLQDNIAVARRKLGMEEGALQTVVDVLQRARELGLRAGSGLLSPQDREAMAVEVDELLDDLVAAANTTDGSGEYIFAGYQVRSRPFAPAAGGGIAYAGDEGQRRLPVGPGFSIALGDSGTAVFRRIRNGNGTFVTGYGASNTGTGVIGPGTVDDPTAWVRDTYTITFTTATDWEVRDSASNLIASGSYTSGAAISFRGISVEITGTPAAGDTFTVAGSANQDMFTALQELAAALRADTSDAAAAAKMQMDLGRALLDIDRALEHATDVRAEVGGRLNALDQQERLNEDLLTLARQHLSEQQDLDYAEAISRFQRQLLAIEAAQRSFARVGSLSLFQYL